MERVTFKRKVSTISCLFRYEAAMVWVLLKTLCCSSGLQWTILAVDSSAQAAIKFASHNDDSLTVANPGMYHAVDKLLAARGRAGGKTEKQAHCNKRCEVSRAASHTTPPHLTPSEEQRNERAFLPKEKILQLPHLSLLL